MNKFGKRLQSLRNEKKLGQKKLAVTLGMSLSSIGKYENNLRTPSTEVLVRMADFFQVSTDYLLGRSDSRLIAGKKLARFCIDPDLPAAAVSEIEGYLKLIGEKYKK